VQLPYVLKPKNNFVLTSACFDLEGPSSGEKFTEIIAFD
jgi:hypothetical protein